MSQTNTLAVPAQTTWKALCARTDLVPNSGVVACVDGQQVALIYLPDTEQQVFAIGNRDPKSGANVIGRGIVASVEGAEVCIGKTELFTDAAQPPPAELAAVVDRLGGGLQ